MPKKLTYEFVKNYIESFDGYKLISKEYKNAMSKIKIKCPEKHIFEMKYSAFQQGHRCRFCQYENISKNLKHSYEYIKGYIESFGYKLISGVYKNSSEKIIIKCPKNHIFKMTYHNFYGGQRCSICFGTPKHSYEYIKGYIESFGYKLISQEYKGNKIKLSVECPEKHIFEIKYNSFLSGTRCSVCWQKCLRSNEEKEIAEYVKNNYNGMVIENDRSQIINPKTGYNLELDIWIPELKKAIEYNGEYWHNNIIAEYRDSQKQLQCKNKGIDLLIIKEENWVNNKDYKTIDEFIGEHNEK